MVAVDLALAITHLEIRRTGAKTGLDILARALAEVSAPSKASVGTEMLGEGRINSDEMYSRA